MNLVRKLGFWWVLNQKIRRYIDWKSITIEKSFQFFSIYWIIFHPQIRDIIIRTFFKFCTRYINWWWSQYHEKKRNFNIYQNFLKYGRGGVYLLSCWRVIFKIQKTKKRKEYTLWHDAKKKEKDERNFKVKKTKTINGHTSSAMIMREEKTCQ